MESMLGSLDTGNEVGIYSVSLAEKRQVSLLPGVRNVFFPIFEDGKSILYAVAEKGTIMIYGAPWSEGKLTAKPASRFVYPYFSLNFNRNAYDLPAIYRSSRMRDPRRPADLYL